MIFLAYSYTDGYSKGCANFSPCPVCRHLKDGSKQEPAQGRGFPLSEHRTNCDLWQVKLQGNWIILGSVMISVGMQAAARKVSQSSQFPLWTGDFQGAAGSSAGPQDSGLGCLVPEALWGQRHCVCLMSVFKIERLVVYQAFPQSGTGKSTFCLPCEHTSSSSSA